MSTTIMAIETAGVLGRMIEVTAVAGYLAVVASVAALAIIPPRRRRWR